jgi:hypothetical protein
MKWGGGQVKRLVEALLLVASLLCLAAVAVLPVYPANPSPSARPSRTTVAAPGDSRAYWEQVLNESRKATRVEPAREPESQALFWLAVSAANLGRLDESTTSFRQLQKADPDRKVERYDGETLTLKSDRFARCVELSAGEDGAGFGWVFEDNYFDLFPFETKKVRILKRGDGGCILAKPQYSTHTAKVNL